MRTLDEIKRDLNSYRSLAKKNPSATIYAEKYVEDVAALVQMLEPKKARSIEAKKETSKKEAKKGKTPES